MRRLTAAAARPRGAGLLQRVLRRVGPTRLGEERGAVAVTVAIVLVPLIGFAAIAIDIASLQSDRTQLRNAADAAAIAVALDCARGACGNPASTATSALTANTAAARGADATVRAPSVAVNGRKITVTTSADQEHWFAPVLGHDSTRVTASATAQWSPTVRGRANFPLIISYCEYMGQIARHPLGTVNTTQRINATTDLGDDNCAGPSGTTYSGYAVTAPDNGSVCRTTSEVGGTVAQFANMYTNRLPSTCTNAYLAGLIGSTILIPVWDKVTGSYPNHRFHVYGYSAFHIAGYDVWAADPALLGYFTYGAQQVDSTVTASLALSSTPDLGARSVFLTNQG